MPDDSTDPGDSPDPLGTGAPPDAFSQGPACFKRKFDGTYKTFRKGDAAFTVLDWAFVHKGACTDCEGQSPPDCIEPGDDS